MTPSTEASEAEGPAVGDGVGVGVFDGSGSADGAGVTETMGVGVETAGLVVGVTAGELELPPPPPQATVKQAAAQTAIFDNVFILHPDETAPPHFRRLRIEGQPATVTGVTATR